MAKEVCFAGSSARCLSTTMLGDRGVCSASLSFGCDRNDDELSTRKSTCGQGGGIGNRKPMSATDSSDAPARSSDARREAWGGAATGSA